MDTCLPILIILDDEISIVSPFAQEPEGECAERGSRTIKAEADGRGSRSWPKRRRIGAVAADLLLSGVLLLDYVLHLNSG